MEKTAVFTISREKKATGYYYTIRCKAYNLYNRYDVHEKQFFESLEDLTDIFNNVIGVGIVFEID